MTPKEKRAAIMRAIHEEMSSVRQFQAVPSSVSYDDGHALTIQQVTYQELADMVIRWYEAAMGTPAENIHTAAGERKACAEVAERVADRVSSGYGPYQNRGTADENPRYLVAQEIAAKIRARGEKAPNIFDVIGQAVNASA